MTGMTDLQTLAAALRARKISVHGLVDESLRQIARLNPQLNAFITVTADAARARARQLDDELASGLDRGALHGIPIAHKDLVRTKGVLTTGGSKILAGYVPERDAVIAAKLDRAGAVLVGKTGLHELAYGVTSNNPHFGPVHNPWDLERIPGGSSGGSAAAVAAGIVPLATGTDTGGSIRIPASFCGVVGLKPTFGRVSARGVLPLSTSLDHVGPITRTVRDAAIAFQAIVDDSRGYPTGYVPPADGEIRGIRIGLPRNFYFERIDVEVGLAVRTAVQTAAAIGARIIEIEVPDMDALNAAARTIQLPEALAVWKAYLGHREDFGADALALLDQGREVAAVDYLEAQRQRRRMGAEFAKLWDRVDCIFTPATPMPAPKIGQQEVRMGGATEEVRTAATRLTRGMNALGLPALSMPCGFTKSGLPIGLQIIAAARAEDMLLRIAAAMEDALGVCARRPPATSDTSDGNWLHRLTA
jgi:aspartyl-tRNA(Asn)/glutamyl-tRNA(Gln) amidotransferase subunit A